MEEEFFTKLDEEKTTEEKEEVVLENPFVTGLPDWDLEPLYDPLKRGNNE